MNNRPLWFCRIYSLPLKLLLWIAGLTDVIDRDADRWVECIANDRLRRANPSDRIALLCTLLPEFRSLIYFRAGDVPALIRIPFQMVWRKQHDLQFGEVEIGPGFFIQHGNNTGIDAARIGEDFWVNQNVTIGNSSKGKPTIGDRVTVHVGAVVIGRITIGDDAVIGANAVVVSDVPAGAVFVAPQATELVRTPRAATE